MLQFFDAKSAIKKALEVAALIRTAHHNMWKARCKQVSTSYPSWEERMVLHQDELDQVSVQNWLLAFDDLNHDRTDLFEENKQEFGDD